MFSGIFISISPLLTLNNLCFFFFFFGGGGGKTLDQLFMSTGSAVVKQRSEPKDVTICAFSTCFVVIFYLSGSSIYSAMGVTMSDPSISFFKTYCTRSFISFKQIGMNTENIEPQKAIKFSFDSCL